MLVKNKKMKFLTLIIIFVGILLIISGSLILFKKEKNNFQEEILEETNIEDSLGTWNGVKYNSIALTDINGTKYLNISLTNNIPKTSEMHNVKITISDKSKQQIFTNIITIPTLAVGETTSIAVEYSKDTLPDDYILEIEIYTSPVESG